MPRQNYRINNDFVIFDCTLLRIAADISSLIISTQKLLELSTCPSGCLRQVSFWGRHL